MFLIVTELLKTQGTIEAVARPKKTRRKTERRPVSTETENQSSPILILGAGVSGLTTGVLLQEKGYDVEIWARDLSPDTTSNVAGAVWFPYKVNPDTDLTVWSGKTLTALEELHVSLGSEATGITISPVIELKHSPSEDPWWKDAVKNLRHALPNELPPGYQDGFVFDAPVVNMDVYLSYLMQTFQSKGGRIKQQTVHDLSEAFNVSSIVINCTGLGSRELVNDRDIHASRGQVIKVRQNGSRRVLIDEDSDAALSYIIPRLNDIVLGGTSEEYSEMLATDEHQTQDILRRCSRLDPAFKNITQSDILRVVAGLRPVRSRVRLKEEYPSPEKILIHNYGHGGAGVTLSWGCAEAVVDLVSKFKK